MSETKTEFVTRKKAEKGAQAVRQVMNAYQQTVIEDVGDEYHTEPTRGFRLNNKFFVWRIQMEPEIEELYSTIDISKVLKIQRERLRDWMVKGFIIPSLPSISKGTIAIFTRADFIGVALFMKLIERNFKREAAARYVKNYVQQTPEQINSINFLTSAFKIKDEKPKFEIAPYIYGSPIELKIDASGNVLSGPFGPMTTNDWRTSTS